MILTLDFWDTIMRRSCHPDLIKRLTGQHLLLSHRSQLKATFRSVEDLFQARTLTERNLGRKYMRRGFDYEYELNEVIVAWLDDVCELPTPDRACIAAMLVQWEWEREKALSFPDPGILPLLQQWHERGAKIYFVSDFYLRADQLMALLRHHGIAAFFEGGITSADLKLNKRSGRLFQWVQRNWLSHGEAHLHLGDDPRSDVSVPKKLGIEAIHYCPPAEHRRRRSREQSYLESRHEPLAGLLSISPKGTDPASTMAARLLPLFVGFGLFVYEQACAYGAERVFFVSREGPFLEKVFRVLAARHPLGKRFESAFIPCSRVSTFGPSLTGWSLEEIDALLQKHPEQTPASFCRSVGIPVSEMLPILHEFGLSADTRFLRADQSPVFRAWIEHPATRRIAEAALAVPNALLDQFLNQCEWTHDLSKAVVVDVGWFGSMQDNLGRMRSQTETLGLYLGVKASAAADRSSLERLGYVFDSRTAAAALDPYLDIAPPVEILCSTNDPSVTAYAWDGAENRVKPVMSGSPRASAQEWELIHTFQETVLHSVKAYAVSDSCWSVTADELQAAARESWRSFIKDPVPEFATMFFHSPLLEEYGVRDPADFPSPSVPASSSSPAGRIRTWIQAFQELRALPWPQGFANCQLCSRFARRFLKLTLPAAYGVRRLRNELSLRRSKSRLVLPDASHPARTGPAGRAAGSTLTPTSATQ